MKAKLRPANKTDLSFVTANWANSARNFPQYAGIPNTVFYHHFQKMMETVIPRCAVTVYCLDDPEIPDDRSNIGYCIYEKSEGSLLVHFIYVKPIFSGKGFAKVLLETIMAFENRNHVIYTAANNKMLRSENYKKLKGLGWLYNPFEIWKIHEG